ncbi:MAG: metal-dependent hydrolase [Vicingaceae bacterium]
MDSLTQIILGGAVGEAVLGKKVGNKAVLWGAVGGTIPDLDTIPGQFLDTVSRLEIHRGFSHSIVFALLMAPLLGFLIHKLYRKKKEANWWGWTQLFFWAIFTHPLLDIFTTWGTQLFWPLDWRIAIQSVFVIDPIYTIPFLICLISVLFFKRKSNRRRKINRLGLWISSCYLLLTVVLKLYADNVFESQLQKQQVEYLRFDSRPTPFNTILWTSNIELKNDFAITYYSFFDKQKNLDLSYFPKNEALLNPYRNNPKVERLIELTKGFYTIEKTNDGIAMNDLRFGLTEGFDQGKGNFVFTYLIEDSKDGIVIRQKEQSFEGMDRVMNKLGKRILGLRSF